MKGNPDSVMQKIFAFRIRNPGLWNPESGIPHFEIWHLDCGIRSTA